MVTTRCLRVCQLGQQASNVCALKFVSLKMKQRCTGTLQGQSLCAHFRTLPQCVIPCAHTCVSSKGQPLIRTANKVHETVVNLKYTWNTVTKQNYIFQATEANIRYSSRLLYTIQYYIGYKVSQHRHQTLLVAECMPSILVIAVNKYYSDKNIFTTYP